MNLLARLIAAPVLGLLSYFFIGIAIPRINGVGRFYSVPIGGYAVRDESVLISAAVWCLIWWLLLSLLFGGRKKGAQR